MLTVDQAFNLALAQHRSGRLAEAELLYRQIVTVQPGHAEALHMIGVIAHQNGRHELAVEWIGRALTVAPQNTAAYSNLGEAYRCLHRLGEAIACYRRAIQLQPQFADAHNNLGNALWSVGQLDEAILECRRALQLQPVYPEALYNLGNALRDRGQTDDAIAAYLRALEIRPDYFMAFNNLGNAYWDQGRVEEAIGAYRRALAGQPEGSGIHSNLVMALHYLPGDQSALIAAEQQSWNRKFGDPLKGEVPSYVNDRLPNRRLRIGYVSPDLRDHVTGRNLLPLFRHHNHDHFEIFCYSGVLRPDAMTEDFRRQSDHWKDTFGVSDETLATTIRSDQIDILVDLSQHGGGNRLPVFARKPAPLQISFAGYPEATGVEAIAYRLSDRWLEGQMQNAGWRIQDACSLLAPTITATQPAPRILHPASFCYLLDSFWCYDSCGIDCPVNSLPAYGSGFVTFGSLNTFRKINEPVLRLWAQVLLRVTHSRLVLLSPEGRHRERPLTILAQEGLPADRVEFVTPRPRSEYLALYHRLDIVLDPFPYQGHTSSLDALWMGVPVVTLTGPRPVSRAGLSHLSNLGLAELVADSADAYRRIAVELAQDLPRLATLRASLRSRMQNSVLMNGLHFARQIETAYRSLWQDWCSETSI
jgi:predicted O-linked N-acetylglucosamine transferase (SPINDLY family)